MHTRSMSELEKEAQKGNVDAMVQLAWNYKFGFNTNKDLQKAAYWYYMAIDTSWADVGLGKLIDTFSPKSYQSQIRSKLAPVRNEIQQLPFIIHENTLLRYHDTGKQKNVIIPDGISIIGKGCFRSVYHVEKITIPPGVIEIGDYAFGSTSIRSLEIPYGVTSIGESAFSSCSAEEIVIPEGVRELRRHVFGDSLKTVTIPASVKYIRGYAFFYCDKLRQINFQGSKEEWSKIIVEEQNKKLRWVRINYNYSYDGLYGGKPKEDPADLRYLDQAYCKTHPNQAHVALRRLTDAGNAEAWNMLGELYYYGIGVAVDKTIAESHYLKAHRLGCVDATYSLGYMYANGDGIPEDVSKGISLLKQAASHNYAKAYRQLGRLYFWGKKVPEDFSISFKYMLRGAELGDGDAQAHVAQAYEVEKWGAPRRDAVAAKHYFDKALKNNSNHAYWCIGQRHLLGINSYPKDEKQAFDYFKTSAELDSDKGCLSLALCYLRGTGTTKDLAAALPWLKKAAEAGNAEAILRYGIALVSGLAGYSFKNYEEGRSMIYKVAAEEPNDDTAKSVVAKLNELERKYGSQVSQAVLHDGADALMCLAKDPIYVEKTDLELNGLQQSQDSCNRVIISHAHVDAYGSLCSGAWDDCFKEISKALQAFMDLNWPNEKDYTSLRKTYGYLAVSSYKMAVEFGAHSFAEAEEYFKKAKPFQGELGKQLAIYYEEFRSGRERPAQERGVIGKIDMLFFQKDYDAAFDLLDQITDPDVFKLNLHTRAILGSLMLGKTPFAEEILESVIRDDSYKIKAKSIYVIKVALEFYYNKYKNTADPQDKIKVQKWIQILKGAGSNTLPVVVKILEEDEQDYGELLRWILE